MKTGARRNEIINLRWGAVNLKAGYFLIGASEGFQTKSKRSRRLPVTPTMDAFFSGLLDEAVKRGKAGPNDFVFVTSTGRPLNRDRLTREAMKLMKRVLGRKTGAIHIWRHTALTLMLQKGADIETVRRVAGHSSLMVTQRYCHSHDVAMQRAMSQLEVDFGGNVALGGTGAKTALKSAQN